MSLRSCWFGLAVWWMIALWGPLQVQAQVPPKLNVIAIGAHPDDCDIRAGGLAIKLVKLGHRVRFVSLTNGDAGHFQMDPKSLAKRRSSEAKEAGKRGGVDYVVLNTKDGMLEPTLKVREQVIEQIRQWQADVVLTHRPNDYHPDHRYAATVVQDAAFMVTVPRIVPDTPALKANPVFLYFQDKFQKPAPFRPDLVVPIEVVLEAKYRMLDAHTSQFYEFLPWLDGKLAQVPKDPAQRLKWLQQWLPTYRSLKSTQDFKNVLSKRYGAAVAAKAHAVEAFEISEYGKQPSRQELQQLFPFAATPVSK